jgi:hypothetical protein
VKLEIFQPTRHLRKTTVFESPNIAASITQTKAAQLRVRKTTPGSCFRELNYRCGIRRVSLLAFHTTRQKEAPCTAVEAGYPIDVGVAVNVSGVQFRPEDFLVGSRVCLKKTALRQSDGNLR